ncbi:DgyrCDS5934 [Dimorphilus gyrociliatus]|uniref:RNA-binding protein NOB1 n=1 Tax=Dimorphilus gyrociliatus TaxID=2664684 RepID=A0A7I8VRA5_9ANNE|nr:DgyrCDS5934 [Dimorphilus gyrociliatus]
MKIKRLVVDSGCFIRNIQLQGLTEHVVTVNEVISEIKDKRTKESLQVLPYEFTLKSPDVEALHHVTNFSKKTGDYASLSATDLKVIALTFALEKEVNGTDHLKNEPGSKVQLKSTWKRFDNPKDISGFFIEKSSDKNSKKEKSTNSQNSQEKVYKSEDEQDKESIQASIESSESSPNAEKTESNEIVNEGEEIPGDAIEASESEENEDDEEGWITPSNVRSIRAKMGNIDLDEKKEIDVACITTDFAMQNVLLQLGLNVISENGMLIKSAKSYILRCFACFKITKKMDKEFCPHCGNANTLKKVSMSVDKDGNVRIYLSRRKKISRRGLKYSLPTPKGGKHANNPILFADQPVPQQRSSKASRKKMDVLNDDFLASSSPFAVKDIYSRSAMLGIKQSGRSRRNPNESGRRK